MSLLPVPPGSIAAIVTHLEKTAPPVAYPAPPRPGLHVRRVERPGLDWYRTLYRRIGEDWLWFSRAVMTDAQLAAVIHHPAVAVYALEAAGEDRGEAIGLLELDWRERPACEIVFFGLVPEAVGAGLGVWLMGEAQRLAFQEGGAERLWLHTCTLDHPNALPFYLARGFRAFKREIEIAPDPRLFDDFRRSAAPHHPIIEPPGGIDRPDGDASPERGVGP